MGADFENSLYPFGKLERVTIESSMYKQLLDDVFVISRIIKVEFAWGLSGQG